MNKPIWKQVEIREILTKINGQSIISQGWSPQCENFPSSSEEDWGVLKTSAIQIGYYVEEENKKLPLHLEPRHQHEVKSGDILITCAGPRNRCGVACLVRKTRRRLMISGKMYRFRPNPEIADARFLEAFLTSQIAWRAIDKMKTGGSESGLNLTHSRFLTLPIPLPPLPIQQAIVARLEALFSELDKGIEQLKTARQQLRTYRQAVLKAAFEGAEHETKRLADVTEKIQIGPFGSQLHKEDYITNGIPLINPMHIQEGKIVADYDYSIRTDKRDSLPNYILEEGDVIMGRRGEMGRSALVTKKEAGWFCGTGSLYFRPKSDKLYSPFLNYFLTSQSTKKFLEENAGGTTMANLNKTIVSDIPIPLPTLQNQIAAVSEVESRLSVADKLEETIAQGLQQAEALRQSILKKAFEGELNIN